LTVSGPNDLKPLSSILLMWGIQSALLTLGSVQSSI
jgi:hypothetical protein